MTNLTDNAKRVLAQRQKEWDGIRNPNTRAATTRPGSLNPHKGGSPRGKRRR